MPLEIKELVIRANIVENNSQDHVDDSTIESTHQSDGSHQADNLQEIAEQVLEILQRQKER